MAYCYAKCVSVTQSLTAQKKCKSSWSSKCVHSWRVVLVICLQCSNRTGVGISDMVPTMLQMFLYEYYTHTFKFTHEDLDVNKPSGSLPKISCCPSLSRTRRQQTLLDGQSIPNSSSCGHKWTTLCKTKVTCNIHLMLKAKDYPLALGSRLDFTVWMHHNREDTT